jgi:hypothetical protein
MKQIKVALALVGITAAAFSLAACQIVASPMAGTTFNETKYGNIATAETATTKEGKACGTSILGAFAQGDASIVAAKANGGITKLHQWTIPPEYLGNLRQMVHDRQEQLILNVRNRRAFGVKPRGALFSARS